MNFGKKQSTSNTGDIEMLTIPSHKRLGNKTRKSSSIIANSSVRNSSVTDASSNLSSINASVSSASAKRLRRFKATNIYIKRVKKSKCRGLNKSTCQHKKRCKFTKGNTRKYCRKKYNKHIN
jgi:hypothetical protein